MNYILAVGGLPLFNVVLVKFYINSMVGINRCMILVVLILIYISLPVNYSYLRIIRLSVTTLIYNKVGFQVQVPIHLLCYSLLNSQLPVCSSTMNSLDFSYDFSEGKS